MSNWSKELDKLRERIEELKKKVKTNQKSLIHISEKIDQNLTEITKYLEASEEVIQQEATEHPKVIKSVDKLTQSITDLENYIGELEVKHQALEQQTNNLKVTYAAGGTLGGIIGAVALWKALPKVKKWLGL
jgi:chromosome segregation ATPase